MSSDNSQGPWHRGYRSRKQQRRFEGNKPTKAVKGKPRYTEDEQPRRRKAA